MGQSIFYSTMGNRGTKNKANEEQHNHRVKIPQDLLLYVTAQVPYQQSSTRMHRTPAWWYEWADLDKTCIKDMSSAERQGCMTYINLISLRPIEALEARWGAGDPLQNAWITHTRKSHKDIQIICPSTSVTQRDDSINYMGVTEPQKERHIKHNNDNRVFFLKSLGIPK